VSDQDDRDVDRDREDEAYERWRDNVKMEYVKRAADIYGTGYSGTFYAFCKDCDAEITGTDPMFYDADGDIDEDGRPFDCSTYLCESCGVSRGYTKEKV
jgi:hypothetical protein